MSPAARRALTGLAGAAAMIAAVTVLSRVLGFGRWLTQSWALSAGSISDSYNAANLLPNVLFEVAAGGALAGALIPLLAAPIARSDRREIDATVSGAVGWTLLILVPLAGLLAAFSGPLAALLADHDPAKQSMVRYFVLVFAIQVPMYGLAVLLYAVLQAHKRFFWPAFAPVLASLVTIATYVGYAALANGAVSDPAGLDDGALEVLAWGTTLGVAAMCLPMLVPVHRLGVRIRPTLHFPPGVAVRLRALALAGVGSVAAQQLATLMIIVVTARYWGQDGTLTIYQYAQQVYLLPYAVLVVPLATSTFPRLAARAAAGDRDGFARTSSAVTRAVVAAAAIGAGAVIAGGYAVGTIFANLTEVDGVAAQMGAALTAMVPGLVGFGALFHGSRSLYALERGRAAVVANVVGWGTMIVAIVVMVLADLPDDQALVGIAAASSIGMTAGGVVALGALRRAAGRDALHGLVRTVVVLVLGAAVGAVAGRWLADTVQDMGGSGSLTAVGAAGGAAVLAAVIAGAALVAFDRSTLTGVLKADQAV
ncbi:murein biosynthesis integral membrane protein MurJ [Cellulomonas rhizosphaerae]|uniref:Virulence factor MviN n=1 Tax=Cellulomonas rhizosphaerae TaxID=2293719 RepID=A0A413RLB0_9CELL|nr:lipid II flippase MurJ [Cellulomonas rhizosphaerae]RHA40482.1 virulence factor MviN [Cellulomonas rhizosphaerae]